MFHKQNARQPVAAVLLVLVLALTSAFSCISFSNWASFRQQLAALDAQYITAAFPINRKIKQVAAMYNGFEGWERLGSIIDPLSYQNPETGEIVLADNISVDALVESAPGVLHRATNVLAAAYTPNQKGVSSGTVEPAAYNQIYDLHRYSTSVMAIRCVDAKPLSESPDQMDYSLEWVAPVCRMDAYDLPGLETEFWTLARMLSYSLRSSSTTEFTIEDATFFPAFEVGKTYLIRGDFLDFPYWKWLRRIPGEPEDSKRMEEYWQREDDEYWHNLEEIEILRPVWAAQSIQILYPAIPAKWPETSLTDIDNDEVGHRRTAIPHFSFDVGDKIVEHADGSSLCSFPVLPEDDWPFYTEYEGDWRDFLNTEKGRVWRDEIIPCCERNYNSVPVLFTDNVQALSQFCKEESALVDGRIITPEEYQTGAAVCLVGAEYALYNGLSVGDTLTLDLYKPAYSTESGFWQLHATYEYFLYTGCMPLVPENRLDVTRDYTIVGLYSAPARPIDPDGHGFRGDTVLAPKASAPEVMAAAPEDPLTPLLNTLILKNGSIDEFETYMAENGAANRFRYYDYGYSAMKGSLSAMESNAVRLALLGGAAFVIGAAVFLLAGFARMAPAARGLRLMGANASFVAQEMLSALLPLTAAGVALGAVLGGVLYGAVCQAVLSQTVAVNWPGLLICAGLELLVLCAAACAWASLAARRRLMR